MNRITMSTISKSASRMMAITVTVGALAGCQLLTGYQTIDRPEAPRAPVRTIKQLPGEFTIACEGTYHCEITKVDNNLLIDSESHNPIPGAKVVAVDQRASMADDRDKVSSSEQALLLPNKLDGLVNYYARLTPGNHEIHVNFYPENNDEYKERFALIHEFKKTGDYRLRAYRAVNNEQSDSLLDSASPDPLCVELLRNNQSVRRFCKLPVDSRQNEFVEVTGISKGAETQALLFSDELISDEESGFDLESDIGRETHQKTTN